jgi:predicted translin family RNA/ssDNA-binding protein
MTRINPEVFARLREAYNSSDEQREHTITHARQITKHSKRAIYLCHEQKYARAQEELAAVKQLRASIRVDGDENQPSYHHALEEYVEAAALLAFSQEQELPTEQDLDVNADTYLAGLCDVTGELIRALTRAAVKKDTHFVQRARDFIDALHGELLQFPLRNNHLRKKADSVKYHLQKAEHVQYELALRSRDD